MRYGIDHGMGDHDAAALNTAVVLYLLMAFAAVFLGRLAILLVARVGEAFLRELRKRLFNHLMSLSLDFFEREKTGKIVARMTSDIDSMQELISQGLVLFVQNILLFCGAVVVIVAHVVAARARRADHRAAGVLREPLVPPASRTRRTSRSATASRRTSRRCRRASKACGSCRPSVASARSRTRFSRTNEDQYEANLETVRISSKYFPIVEFAGVAGTAVIIGYGG